MAKPDNLSKDMDRLDQQITALQDYLHEAELYPEQVHFCGRVRRAVSLFLIRRHVMRQIQYLCVRRRMLRNCILYASNAEPEQGSSHEVEWPVQTHRP